METLHHGRPVTEAIRGGLLIILRQSCIGRPLFRCCSARGGLLSPNKARMLQPKDIEPALFVKMVLLSDTPHMQSGIEHEFKILEKQA